jgi:hypothetical protein
MPRFFQQNYCILRHTVSNSNSRHNQWFLIKAINLSQSNAMNPMFETLQPCGGVDTT